MVKQTLQLLQLGSEKRRGRTGTSLPPAPLAQAAAAVTVPVVVAQVIVIAAIVGKRLNTPWIRPPVWFLEGQRVTLE